MNNMGEPTEGRSGMQGVARASETLSSSAVDRRRALLKGVGRGSALLAATVPLKTLAGTRVITTDQHQCTVSGMHSGVHSVTSDNPTCVGYTPSYWGKSSNYCVSPTNAWPTLPSSWKHSTPCKTVFTRSSSSLTLLQEINKTTTSDDGHWICAWLNSLLNSSSTTAGLYFPYSSDAVMGFYNASNADALSFFKGYMENKIS